MSFNFIQNGFEAFKTLGAEKLKSGLSSTPLAQLRESIGKFKASIISRKSSYAEYIAGFSSIITDLHFDFDSEAGYCEVDRSVFDQVKELVQNRGTESELELGRVKVGSKVLTFSLSNGCTMYVVYEEEDLNLPPAQRHGERISMVACKASGDSDALAVLDQGTALSLPISIIEPQGPCTVYIRPLGNDFFTEGHPFTIQDFIDNLICQDTLNDYITEACDVTLGNRDVLSWVNTAMNTIATFRNAVSLRYRYVKRFIDQVREGFVTGGIKGAIGAILNWAISGSSVAKDSDGYMAFSLNANLTPSLYLFGILQVVTSLITTVISAIVMIFSRIAGVVLSAIGNAMTALFSTISSDWKNKTTAGINAGDDVPCPWSPLSGFKFTISSFSASCPLGGLLTSLGTVLLEAPFGYLLLGAAGPITNGTMPIRGEFHPSIIDNRNAARTVVNTFYRGSSTGTEQTAHRYDLERRSDQNSTDEILFAILRVLEQEEPSDRVLFNNADGVLSLSDDKELRSIVCCNLALGCLYLLCARLNSAQTISLANFWANDIGQAWAPTGSGSLSMIDQCFELLAHNATFTWNTAPTPEWSQITSLSGFDTILNQSEVPAIFSMLDGTNPPSWSCIGLPIGLPTTASFAHSVPQYDGSTFWAIVGLTMAVIVATTVAVAVTTIKVKKSFAVKNAAKKAEVEKAWTNLTDNPTTENALAYRKAARSYNRTYGLFSGTKYDASDYWGSSGEGSSSNVSDLSAMYDSAAPASIDTILKVIVGS